MFSALRCIQCRQIFRPAIMKVESRQRSNRICSSCEKDDLPASRTIQATDQLAGETQKLIHALKYRNQRRVVAELADRLVATIHNDPNAPKYDIVTWAPTSSMRLQKRGYDQSELLARAVAIRLGIKCRRLLYRDRSDPQTGRNREQRLNGPMFRARPMRRPSQVLVIDDVVTTGSTLRAAAHALDMAGARQVQLLAVAATPNVRRPTNSRVA